MKCPKCNENAPDNNYKCPHCGEVLKPAVTPGDFRKQPAKRPRISPNLVILSIVVVGIAVLIYAAFFKGNKAKVPEKIDVNPVTSTTTSTSAAAPTVGYVINKENPGEEIDIREFIQPDKTTIFDFFSEYCGPCKRISPMLVRLDSKRDDIIVHQVDINRPEIRGIDWDSPVAKQYNIHSVPYFMIYDPSGNLTHQGQEAYNEVIRLLQGN